MKVRCPKCRGSGVLSEVTLPTVHYKVLIAIREAKNGIGMPALISYVYGDDESGGPLHARNAIIATIRSLNQRIEDEGFQIKATKRGRGALFRWVRINV